MKKLLCLFSASLLVLTSCSNDEPTPVNPSEVLVKKTIDSSDESVLTSNFTYDGNKIVTVSGTEVFPDTSVDNFTDNYIYENNLLTRSEYFIDGVLDQTDIYEYNSENKVIKHIRLSHYNDWGNKSIFTYNTDGTITCQNYIGDLTSQTQLNDTKLLTLNNGNVMSYGSDIFTYDSKNDPYKNIFAYDIITITGQEGGVNNELSYTSESHSTTTTYTYNSNDYPITGTESDTNGVISTTQYFYE